MLFPKNQKHIKNINIVIHGMNIERVESLKFLGITPTETLCWDNHVILVKKDNFKSNRNIIQIKKHIIII